MQPPESAPVVDVCEPSATGEGSNGKPRCVWSSFVCAAGFRLLFLLIVWVTLAGSLAQCLRVCESASRSYPSGLRVSARRVGWRRVGERNSTAGARQVYHLEPTNWRPCVASCARKPSQRNRRKLQCRPMSTVDRRRRQAPLAGCEAASQRGSGKSR